MAPRSIIGSIKGQVSVSHLKSAMDSTARADSQTVGHLRRAIEGTSHHSERQQTVAHLAKPLCSDRPAPQAGSQGSQPAQGSQGSQGQSSSQGADRK